MKPPLDIGSHSDVVPPRRNTPEHVNKPLQILEPFTRIELVTFRYGRSTNCPTLIRLLQELEPLTRIELVTSSLPRTRSTN
jgi:hypothetical protein